MAKLVVSRGGSIVHQSFLEQKRVNVGRESHNHVVIDDPAVDAEHAAIVPVGNDHILEDLGSVYGTFVNGTRVRKHILQHGDVIEFGAHYLRYMNPKASADRDLERTMLITGLGGTAVGGERESGPPKSAGVPSARHPSVNFPKGRIRVIAGSGAGDAIELDRVVATFGRSGDRLAVIARRPHGYFITHVEGRNYPRVNRQSIGKEARALRHGDVIEVGDQQLEFLLDQGASA